MARYHEIADSLRSAIVDGHYALGSQLPGEHELSQTYGVAPGTIRQALGDLVAEGVLAARRGSRRTVIGVPKKTGTFEEFRSFAQWAWSQGKNPTGQVVSARWRTASLQDREHLQLDRAALIYLVLRVRALDGEAVMIERTRYAPNLGEHVVHIPDDCPSVTNWLTENAGTVFSRAEHRFSACAASSEDARLLPVRRGAPLLSHVRISFGQDGSPLEWSEDRYVADSLSLVVDNSMNSNVLRWA